MTFRSRETHSIEHHVEGLVRLLEVCHTHNLKPTVKDSDPPHAKIASDIMSCLFMVGIKKNLPMQYTETFSILKIENFQLKHFFLIFAQNVDCGYTLEPPHRGGSNVYPQSMFWSKNKNQRTNGPVNAHLSLLHVPINMLEYYGIKPQCRGR